MNNYLNILPKQAKFDLKSSKVRWRRGRAYDTPPDPLIVREPPITNSWLRHCLLNCCTRNSAMTNATHTVTGVPTSF